MDVPTWVWLATLGVAAAVLAFDVWVARKPHVPSTREVGTVLGIYVSAAVLFGIGLWLMEGGDRGTEFFAGWLTEYSLSIDNLFIFIIIMAKFGVPARFQQTALLWGIIIAIVLRTIFIFVGAAAINQFAWVFYIFGAFLLYTAVKLATESHDDEEEDWEPNAMIKWFQKTVPSTEEWSAKVFTKENGKRVATPLFIVIVALGMTDLLFALDSIPAIYGLTKEPYIVLTANLFALMGLRQLYFLIGGLLKKLVYMSLGLSVLLAFIGFKLIVHALHENEVPFINGGEAVHAIPEIPITVSLGVIVLILAVTAVASLWKTRNDEKQQVGSGD